MGRTEVHYPYRRVVTGVDEQGLSRVLFDDGNRIETGEGPSYVALLWQSEGCPADNSSPLDTAKEGFSFNYARGGTKLMIVEFAPSPDLVPPGMHATNTLDYAIILDGRLSLYLEQGEVEVGAGDIVVNRGNIHGWRNPGDSVARMAVVGIDACAVAGGATI